MIDQTQSYTVEIRDARGRVVWSREAVPGSMIARFAPIVGQADESMKAVGQAASGLGAAWSALRKLGGASALLLALSLPGCWSASDSIRASSTTLRVSVEELVGCSAPRGDFPAAVWSGLATATLEHAQELEARAHE